MSRVVPKNKPRWSDEKVRKHIAKLGVKGAVVLLGVRGYYRDSMGTVGRNDRGIYDDAIFLVSPNGVVSFNANTDPSKYRNKTSRRNGMATLKVGLWAYKLGIHGLSKPKNRRYQALVQAQSVTVIRDPGYEDTGWFGINIHRGGWKSTSSLGCQTIYAPQWDAFIALAKSELKRFRQGRHVWYALIEAQG